MNLVGGAAIGCLFELIPYSHLICNKPLEQLTTACTRNSYPHTKSYQWDCQHFLLGGLVRTEIAVIERARSPLSLWPRNPANPDILL